MIPLASNAVRPIGSTPRPTPPTVATMTRRTLTLVLLTITALIAACGDDSSNEDQTQPISQQVQADTTDLTVRVTADTIGTAGCTQATRLSGVQVGNDSRLTITDANGTTIGTGTFNLTPGANTCDWTATATIPTSADFYNLDASGQLATYSRSELTDADWTVDLNINSRGDIR